jgi:hypothetical protein
MLRSNAGVLRPTQHSGSFIRALWFVLMSHRRRLSLYDNRLNGSIPSSIGRLTALT